MCSSIPQAADVGTAESVNLTEPAPSPQQKQGVLRGETLFENQRSNAYVRIWRGRELLQDKTA